MSKTRTFIQLKSGYIPGTNQEVRKGVVDVDYIVAIYEAGSGLTAITLSGGSIMNSVESLTDFTARYLEAVGEENVHTQF